jgi:uncharacterized membrane protein
MRSSDGTITTFDPADSVATNVTGINDNGTIIGFYFTALDPYYKRSIGFVRTPDGTITSFRAPNSVATEPIAVNSHGVIVGEYTTRTTRDGRLVLHHGFIRSN